MTGAEFGNFGRNSIKFDIRIWLSRNAQHTILQRNRRVMQKDPAIGQMQHGIRATSDTDFLCLKDFGAFDVTFTTGPAETVANK
jgi:hypothetical protein